MPAVITDAPTGVLLCEIELVEPLGTVASGALVWALPDAAIALASGTAHWARFVDGNGASSIDCSVTDTAGAGPIKMADLNVLAGGDMGIVSAIFG